MNDFSPYVLLEVHRAASQSPISLSSLALFHIGGPDGNIPALGQTQKSNRNRAMSDPSLIPDVAMVIG
jgi:hypothetical protein